MAQSKRRRWSCGSSGLVRCWFMTVRGEKNFELRIWETILFIKRTELQVTVRSNALRCSMARRDSQVLVVVTGKEDSSPWGHAGSHVFFNYSAAANKTLASTIYTEQWRILPLSDLFGQGTCITGSRKEWVAHVNVSRLLHTKSPVAKLLGVVCILGLPHICGMQ